MYQDWSYRLTGSYHGVDVYGVFDERGLIVVNAVGLEEAKRIVDKANAKGRLSNDNCVRIDGVRYFDYDKLSDMPELARPSGNT
jgi:hypothetical protein